MLKKTIQQMQTEWIGHSYHTTKGENKIKLFIVHFSDCFRWHTKGKKDSYFTHLEFHKKLEFA